MKNQPLALFEKALDPSSWTNGTIPLPTTKELDEIIAVSGNDPQAYMDLCGWALPSKEFIETSLRHMRQHNVTSVVGLGSGGAYLERLLQLAGLEVTATDRDTRRDGHYYRFIDCDDQLTSASRGKFQMDVQGIDAATALTKYRGRAVFMSWPVPALKEQVREVFRNGPVPQGTLVLVIRDPRLFERIPTRFRAAARVMNSILPNCRTCEEVPLPAHPHSSAGSSVLYVLQKR